MMTISKLMFITIVCAHWMACLFYKVAKHAENSMFASWITNAGIADSTIQEKYVYSLYWTITTMATVGYGDIKP